MVLITPRGDHEIGIKSLRTCKESCVGDIDIP